MGQVIDTRIVFDYGELEAKEAKQLQKSAEKIRSMLKRSVTDIIAIGNELSSAKERLKHGQFMKWIGAEFGWNTKTTHNFCHVAEKLGNFPNLESLQPSAAYLLAAPSTPDPAFQEAVELAEKGKEVTHAKAKEIIEKHKRNKQETSSTLKARTQRLFNLNDELVEFDKVVDALADRMPLDCYQGFATHLRNIAKHLERVYENRSGDGGTRSTAESEPRLEVSHRRAN